MSSSRNGQTEKEKKKKKKRKKEDINITPRTHFPIICTSQQSVIQDFTPQRRTHRIHPDSAEARTQQSQQLQPPQQQQQNNTYDQHPSPSLCAVGRALRHSTVAGCPRATRSSCPPTAELRDLAPTCVSTVARPAPSQSDRRVKSPPAPASFCLS